MEHDPMPGSRTERRYSLAAAAVIVVVLVSNYLCWGTRAWNQGDLDEAGWISCTYYYHLAFRQRDLRSPDWKNADCLDHPPLMKYVLGAGLAVQGFTVDSMALRDRTMGEMVPGRGEALFEYLQREIPRSAFLTGRALSTLWTALAAWMLYFLARRCFGPRVALISVLAFCLSSLTRYFAVLIMSDALLLFLVLLTTWLQFSLVASLDNPSRRTWPIAILLGIACALFVNTKILGGAQVIISGGAIIGWMSLRHGNQRPTMFSFLTRVAGVSALFLATFVGTAIAMNPSYHTRPLQFATAAIRWRNLVVQTQHAILPQLMLPNPLVKASGLISSIGYVGLRPWPSIPTAEHNLGWSSRRREEYPSLRLARDMVAFLGVYCTALGSVRLWRLYAKTPRETFLFGFNAFAWLAVVWYCFQHNLVRYALPLFPFVCILLGLGANEMLRAMMRSARCSSNKHARPRRRRFWFSFLFDKRSSAAWTPRYPFVVAMALTAIAFGVFLGGDIDRFMARNPGWIESRRKASPSLDYFDNLFGEIIISVQD